MSAKPGEPLCSTPFSQVGGCIESSARLGRYRWTIERTGAWLGGWRRLRIRYDRGSERCYALVLLACSVICFQALRPPRW